MTIEWKGTPMKIEVEIGSNLKETLNYMVERMYMMDESIEPKEIFEGVAEIIRAMNENKWEDLKDKWDS